MSKWASHFKDSRWQKKRLEIMERDEWACRSCGASGEGVTLNVHHIHYESGKAPWEYPEHMLVTWCEKCHAAIHDLQHMLLKRICSIDTPIPLIKRLVGYSDAYWGPCFHSGDDYERGYADCAIQCNDSNVAAICQAASSGGERRPL